MLKKVSILVLFLVGLFALAIWSPWYKWNINFYSIFGIENVDKYSGLKVMSLAGEIDIYVDNEYKGVISDNEDFADISSLKAGSHNITLKNKNMVSFYTFSKDLVFEPGVDVVVAYDLGPNEKFSEGHIFYTRKNYTHTGMAKLFIYASPEKSKVYLDDVFIGESPILSIDLDIDMQHKIQIQSEGYQTLEFTILPTEIDSRKKLLDFDLILEAKLFLLPVKIVN